MRKRKSERGQALAELIISMVGLCAVMIGLMVVAVLGMSGIRNAITAREKADKNSISGIENGFPLPENGGPPGRAVMFWSRRAHDEPMDS